MPFSSNSKVLTSYFDHNDRRITVPTAKKEEVEGVLMMLDVLNKDELKDLHDMVYGNAGGSRDKANLAFSVVHGRDWSIGAVLSMLSVKQLKDLVDLVGEPVSGLRKNDLIDILMDKISPRRKPVAVATVAPIVNKVVKENKALKAELARAERENEALNVTMDRMAIASRQSNEPCRNLFGKGFCTYGATCKFSHDMRSL